MRYTEYAIRLDGEILRENGFSGGAVITHTYDEAMEFIRDQRRMCKDIPGYKPNLELLAREVVVGRWRRRGKPGRRRTQLWKLKH